MATLQPVPLKTWQATYGASLAAQNILFTTGANDNKRQLFLIKQILTGFPLQPWTVQKSSDGSANAGAADYWVTSANIVHAAAGSNHSWIVLRQTGIGATAEILIDCSNASTNVATIKFAPGGFDTGGTLTNAPTASGSSSTLCNNTSYLTNFTSFTGYIHVLMSTDGQCTRVIWARANAVEGFWCFEKISPVTTVATDFGGSVPFLGYCGGSNTGAVGAYVSDGTFGLSGAGTVKPRVLIVSPGPVTTDGAMALVTDNYIARWHGGRLYLEMDEEYGFVACPTPGVFGSQTALTRGHHGRIQDMWIGTSDFSNDLGRPGVKLGEHAAVGADPYGLVCLHGVWIPWPAGVESKWF